MKKQSSTTEMNNENELIDWFDENEFIQMIFHIKRINFHLCFTFNFEDNFHVAGEHQINIQNDFFPADVGLVHLEIMIFRSDELVRSQ